MLQAWKWLKLATTFPFCKNPHPFPFLLFNFTVASFELGAKARFYGIVMHDFTLYLEFKVVILPLTLSRTGEGKVK